MEEKNHLFTEYTEYLKTQVKVNKGAASAIFFSIPVIFFITRFFNLNFPPGLLVIIGIFAIVISVYVSLLSKRLEEKRDAKEVTFFYLISNVLIYTFIIHYLGGIEGIGIILYYFLIAEANILLSRKQALTVIFAAIFSFSIMVFLEYHSVIPHYEFFLTGPVKYDNLNYVIFTVVLGAVFSFNYVGIIAGNFSNIYRKISEVLKKERKELLSAQAQLKESRDSLEVRVEARTKELKKMTENLEKEVLQRSKELEEKVEELEKFQKFTLGREIKYKELKEKVRNFKIREE